MLQPAYISLGRAFANFSENRGGFCSQRVRWARKRPGCGMNGKSHNLSFASMQQEADKIVYLTELLGGSTVGW